MTAANIVSGEAWPSLALERWSDTCATLHPWTQIARKIRLVQTPWTNHSWHVTLIRHPKGVSIFSRTLYVILNVEGCRKLQLSLGV